MKQQATCKYHCRRCDSHFTSLVAFDAHHKGSGETLESCFFPEKSGLVEITGICRIDDPEHPRNDVTLYEHESAQTAREYFAGRQAVST